MANETTIVPGVAADIVQDVATGQQQVQANIEIGNAPISTSNPLPVKATDTAPASANSVTAAASALLS
jgi:hypothetical protein